MTTITPEQRRAVEPAGDAPVRLMDPQTNTAYVLIKEDVYLRARQFMEDEEQAIRASSIVLRVRSFGSSPRSAASER